MLGRIGRDRSKPAIDDEPSIHGVASLLGGDGVSLDGESVQLPEDRYPLDNDDISSINTSTYGGTGVVGSSFRVVGKGDSPVDPIGQTIGNTGKVKEGDGDTDSERRGAAFCVPAWIAGAKPWLKAVIVLSTALLVGAVVLIVVAAGLTDSNKSGAADSSQSSSDFSSPPSVPIQNVSSMPLVPVSFSTSPAPSAATTTAPSSATTATQSEPTTGTPPISTSTSPTNINSLVFPTMVPSLSQPTGMPDAKGQEEIPVPVGKTIAPSGIPTVFVSTVPVSSPSTSSEDPVTQVPFGQIPTTLSPIIPPILAGSGSPSFVVSTFPSVAPIVITVTNAPLEPPVVITVAPVSAPVSSPNIGFPTLSPIAPFANNPPVVTPASSSIVFYLTGGRPQTDILDIFTTLLPTIPDEGSSFMVHLGDWNSPFTTRCNESSYQDVDSLYSVSSVPVFFVPADNEYNDCPDPEEAFGFWLQYLTNYEKKYWPPATYTVSTDLPDYEENFAFVVNRVLCIGVNVVGGSVHNATEWATRQEADLDWIQTNFETFGAEVSTIAIFAHADPDVDTNSAFYTPLQSRVALLYQMPTILFHRNLGTEGWGVEESFNGIANFTVVVIEGGIWPPMRVEIDPVLGLFQFDQSQWYDSLG